MTSKKILIVEDNEVIRRALAMQLQRRQFAVVGVSTLAVAQDHLGKDNFDLVFVDVRLPDGEGTDILRILQNRSVKPLVVMMTGHASIESAVACMRDGAFDYLIKPFSSDQIDITLKKAQEFTQLLKVNRYLSQGDPSEATGSELLGRSPAMQALRDLIRKVARTQATVLVQVRAARARSWSPGPSTARVPGPTVPSSRSTVRPSRRTSSRASSSAMRRGPSPVR